MGKLMEGKELSVILLIGDMDDQLLQSLLMNESPSLKQKNELLLDTKYYTAQVRVESLRTVEKINEWSNSSERRNIGAVIYNYDSDLWSLKQLKFQLSTWQAEVQVAVCKRLEGSADWSENLREFCAAERIELIELNPDKETVEELNECSELYGISRIRQVLEAGDWNCKVMKKDPLGLKGQRCTTNESFPYNNSAGKLFESSIDSDDIEFNETDVTEEDIEMILKLFGGPKTSFDSLVKDVDSPDPVVIQYFKQETERLKRQEKAAKKKKRKKLKAVTASECGDSFDANAAVDALARDSSSLMGSTNHGQKDTCAAEQSKKTEQGLTNNEAEGGEKKLTEKTHEFGDVARSMIDELMDKNATEPRDDERLINLANRIDEMRSALSGMPFGSDRQNLAANVMKDMIKSLGAEDLFDGSSDDERRNEISEDA